MYYLLGQRFDIYGICTKIPLFDDKVMVLANDHVKINEISKYYTIFHEWQLSTNNYINFVPKYTFSSMSTGPNQHV